MTGTPRRAQAWASTRRASSGMLAPLGLLKLGNADDGPELTGRFAPDTKLGVGDDISVSLALDHFHLFEPDTGAAIRGAGW